jgi:hypothetical protein
MALDNTILTPIDYHDDQFDQMVATTLDKVRSTLTDQITKKIVTLAWLNSKARMTVDGGLTIRRPMIYDYNSTIGSYSGYDLIDTTPQEGLGFAQYEYFSFAGSLTISGEEVDKNSGSAAIINLLSAKVQQLNFSFERWLNQCIWGTQPTPNAALDMISIPEIVNDVDPGTDIFPVRGTTFPLGGVPSATVNAEGDQFWIADATQVGDLTTLAGVKALNAALNRLMVNGSKPDLEITTQAAYEEYEFLTLSSTLRYTSNKMADLGFESVSHKSAEIVWDDEISRVADPAGTGAADIYENPWYFLNSNHLEFTQHSNTWMRRTDFQRPYNQDAKTALVLSRGQLLTDCRRAHGVLKVVTVP